jgi:hypothetical protein
MLDPIKPTNPTQAEIKDLYTRSPADSFGFDLHQRRIEAIPALLESYLQKEMPKINLQPGRVDCTGIGSSEAHARYLAGLLNRIKGFYAQFRPLDLDFTRTKWSEQVAVFSQGLSSNTHAAVKHAINQKSGVVVTAASLDDETLNSTRRTQLEKCNKAGVSIVEIPLRSEYEVLMRTIGPWFGYLAAYRIANQIDPSHFPDIDADSLLNMFSSAQNKAVSLVNQGLQRDQLERGMVTLLNTDVSRWTLENMRMKLYEGLFIAKPAEDSLISFGHGPVQVISRRPGTVIAFHTDEETEVANLKPVREAVEKSVGAKMFEIASPLGDLAILEWEQVMNWVVLSGMREGNSKCDQVNFAEISTYHIVTEY